MTVECLAESAMHHLPRTIFRFVLLSALGASVTAGMAAGTISAGLVGEPYDVRERHSSLGIIATFALAVLAIFFAQDTFQGLVYSQSLLSLQLPITVFTQIYLTSSQKVMGPYANPRPLKLILFSIAVTITALNILLLMGE